MSGIVHISPKGKTIKHFSAQRGILVYWSNPLSPLNVMEFTLISPDRRTIGTKP
jgi:hypothetical protein